MKHRRELTISIILLNLGIICQCLSHLFRESKLNQNFINLDLVSGISLAFLIASMSFNIRLIRDFTAPKKITKASRITLLISMIYLVVIYAI